MDRTRRFEYPFVKHSPSLTAVSKILLVLIVTTLGVGLRYYAAPRLPVQVDERVYFKAALEYASFFREGQWKMLSWYDYNSQHPPLQKIVYGVALLTQPPMGQFWDKDFPDGKAMSRVDAAPWGMIDRYVSVIFGGLSTLALAAVNPIAGLFYAINTRAVQYNSSIFLESLPTLASLLCVICYLHWYKRIQQKSQDRYKNFIWLGLSACFLGIAAASKYNYAVVGIAILVHFTGAVLLKKIRPIDIWKLAAWGVLALVIFFICDPYIWKHPVSRLLGSLNFHANYSQTDIVKEAKYPFYQPLVWFSAPVTTFEPFQEEGGSYLIKLDTLIGLLALAGLPRLIKRQPLYFIWFAIGLFMLLIWTTKWAQYTMIIMAPVCLSAAMGAHWFFDRLENELIAWRNRSKKASLI